MKAMAAVYGVMARSPLARSRRFARIVRSAPLGPVVRLGTDYGASAVPDELIGSDWVCYSGGAGNDISFDLELIERYGCTVHSFDPTPSAARHVAVAAQGEDRFRFFEYGLWSADERIRFYAPDYGDSNFSAMNIHRTSEYFEAQCRSLPSIMRELGHKRIDLLKLDIEGAEYEVLPLLLDGELEVRVLCVQFHKTPGIRKMARAVRQLRRRGYRPVYLHGFDLTFVGPSHNASS